MRTKVVLTLALVALLLTPDPAQGWWTGRRVDWGKIANTAVRAYQTYKYYHALGKRGAPLPDPLKESDLNTVAKDLVEACPKTTDADDALATLTAHFQKIDENKDKSLTGQERDKFIGFLGTLGPC